MTEAFHTLRRAVIDRVERRELPVDDVEAIRAEVERVVADYERLARLGDALPLADPTATIQQVVHSIADLGPLTDVLARDDVEEVFIEGARVVYLDSTGRLRGLSIPTSEEENRHVVERLLATTDRVLNARHPIVSARVLGGAARLTAAIPPISDVLSATIRRYVVRDVTLDDLVGRETLDREAAEFLKLVMRMRSRVAVSGEPGAGKTTMLAALLHAAPAGQCIRCCEEIRELAVPLVHGGYYEVRPSGIDGTGEITLRDLVKFVLGMRPDRIVVGEVRGSEAYELTRAVNAGCGFLCTVHANSASGALHALVNAALMAGENVTERVVTRVFSDAIDLVVHLDRDDAGPGPVATRRRVSEITAVGPSLGDGFSCEPLFVRASPSGPLEWTGVVPTRLAARCTRTLPAGTGLGSVLERGASTT